MNSNYLEKLFRPDQKQRPDLTAIADLVGTSPEALDAFEQAYHKAEFHGLSDNLFQINSRQAAAEKEGVTEGQNEDLVQCVANELVSQSIVYDFDGKTSTVIDFQNELSNENAVSRDEIQNADPASSPMFTGRFIHVDVPGSGKMLLNTYLDMQNTKNPKLRKTKYDHFRQGLDILDMDNIMWEMIDTNPNSMGNWLPYIAGPVVDAGFFRIPKTRIAKLPIAVMQLMREFDYIDLNRATLDVIDRWCYEIFGL